jgi:hypothetical protein
MKNFKNLMLGAVAVAMAAVGSAATIPVAATATYGTPNFGTGTTATWVSLSSLGATTPGALVNFFAVGSICFNPGAGSCVGGPDVAASGITNPIVGGFVASSGSTSFLSSGLGAINTISSGDWTNDFTNDFVVTAAGTGNVLVPNGANFVVFVFRDSFYNDNVDNGGDFGVNLSITNPQVVPEPATYAMMLAGLGAVAAFKRYRRS